MRLLFNLLVLFLFVILLSACSDQSVVEVEEEYDPVLYENSFESLRDMIGFEYTSVESITPMNGGRQSVSVTIECDMPEAAANIGPYAESVDVIVSVQAFLDPKFINSNAQMILRMDNRDDEVWTYEVTEHTWEEIKSEVITIPKSSRLYIEFSAGGFIDSKAFFDLLKVERAEEN